MDKILHLNKYLVFELPCSPDTLQRKISRLISSFEDPRLTYYANNDFEYDFVISYDDVRRSFGNINYSNYFDYNICAKFYAIQFLLNPNFYSILNKFIGEEDNG